MKQQIEQVKAFMKVMGQFMSDVPVIPENDIRSLRFSLIQEENEELVTADNIVDVADALCDSLYVLLGAFNAYGFSPELLEELFNEVQRSNLSKVCKSLTEAKDTKAKYGQQKIETVIKEVRLEGEKYWTVVRLDGKVLKSIKWSEPQLKPILERHGVKC